jgi:hypothetical protein
MAGNRSAKQQEPDPDFFWPDGSVRSQGNAFDWRAWKKHVDMTEEDAALRGSANSIATKRRRGQSTRLKLHLNGTKFAAPEPESEAA